MVAVDESASDDVDAQVDDDLEDGHRRYARASEDVLNAVFAAVLVAIAALIANAAHETMVGLESDVLAGWNQLPDAFGKFVIGGVQVLALVYPIALAIVLLVNRQVRATVVEVSAGVIATAAMFGIDWVVNREIPPGLTQRLSADAWVYGSAFPDAAYLAAATAVATILARYVGRRWGRAAGYLVIVFVFVRLVSGTDLATHILLAVSVGWLVGSLVLLAAGSPNLTPTRSAVRSALADAGFEAVSLRHGRASATASNPWVVDLDDGRRIFVKVLGQNDRSSDLLFRLARFVRLKNVGDEHLILSLRRAVEHEALVALKARDDLVRTPRLLAISPVGADSMMLVFESVDGRSLDTVDPDSLDDDVLEAVWDQVALLHQGRVAHRDLVPSNLILDNRGRVSVVDFGFSELAAPDRRFSQDTAELLAALTVLVGPERTVRAAVGALGAEAVGRAELFLQPPALSGPTRNRISRTEGGLKALRSEVEEQCGIDVPEFEPITRVRPRTVFVVVAAAVAFYVLLPQLADFSTTLDQIRAGNWGIIILAALASALTYLGAAIAFAGAVPTRPPFGANLLAQLAGSFTNRITPASVGGFALQIRFLQRLGTSSPQAVAAVGVDAVSGLIVHIVLALAAVAWAGSGSFSVGLPSRNLVIALLVIVGVMVIVVVATPWGRRTLLARAMDPIRSAWEGLRVVGRSPAKVIALFGGSVLVTCSFIACLYASVKAFDNVGTLATVAVVYLAASAVGAAAPTPGGLGAMEAALIAGLTATGITDSVAVSAVLMFRLLTFWLPIVPGWAAFHVLTRRGDI